MGKLRNKYEFCHADWYGPNGKRFKPYYCFEGYNYDSKTDSLLEGSMCPSWNERCEFLKVRKRRVRI